jgi:hypothetical protein
MLGHLARRQHGVFTRRQAAEVGFTSSEVDGRVRRAEWVSVDHGVYRSAETADSWKQRLMAACLVGPAVASHRAAAALWELVGIPPDVVEVTAVRHRRRKRYDVVWHESVRLEERCVTEIDGIPVTDPTRTILDLGAVVDVTRLLAALDDATRRKLISLDGLRHELERWDPRRRGSARVRRAVAARLGEPVPASELETEFCALVDSYELPHPCRQWPVRADDGLVLARVDFAYPAARLVIEIDGLRFHGGPDDWRADLKRQNVVMSRGYRVLRFTADDIRSRPDQVNATIRTALAPQDASVDPPHDGERRNR